MTKLVYAEGSVALAVAFHEERWENVVAAFRILRSDGFEAASSTLLRTEVRRVFFRGGQSFTGADESVAWINLVELGGQAVAQAGEFAVHVKTLNAIHIAAAQLLDDEETLLLMWTLDQQMARAAQHLGLELVDMGA